MTLLSFLVALLIGVPMLFPVALLIAPIPLALLGACGAVVLRVEKLLAHYAKVRPSLDPHLAERLYPSLFQIRGRPDPQRNDYGRVA